MAVAFPERRVLEIWQGSLQNRTDLVTEEKEPITIIYPGRTNDDRGADLRDTVIATRQGLLKGDIEIHVKSSSWWSHGHHRDPAYNRVVLHVVYENDAGKAIVLENGIKVPTLALYRYLGAPASYNMAPVARCRQAVHRQDVQIIGLTLNEAGVRRFLSTAARFQETIALTGAGQALYLGIMTALGYSRNKEAMAELAASMPLPRLESGVSSTGPDGECLAQFQARLLGMAGLLPSQHSLAFRAACSTEEWVVKLENVWAACGETAVMSAADWRFFKVRPGNYPVRRLAAMSYLLLRYRKEGLLAGLKSVLQAAAEENAGRFLETSLLVNPDSFWGRYLDFGQPGGAIMPALLGRERAGEIVINVLLPFAAAAGFGGEPPGLPEKARKIYHDCRAAPENALVKHMRRQFGIGRPLIATAPRQQGLIHIYKTRCSQGKCDECPLHPDISDVG